MFILGAVASFGFAPYYFWPLTLISIGLAYYFNRGYKTGFWFGVGYGLFSFSWAMESIFASTEIASQFWWAYIPGLIGIGLMSGLVFGLPFYLIGKKQGGERIIYFALAWAFILWLREWFLTGFPWNPLANIFINTPIAHLMSYIGALGVTFFIVIFIAFISEVIRYKKYLYLLFLMPLFGLFFIQAPPTELTNAKVRIVQPAFNMNQKFDRASIEENLRILTELSKGDKVDLVIWPETAFPYAINSKVVLPALGVPLITGAVYYMDKKFYNAMVMTDENGVITNRYFKHHLVPFGEYSPVGDWLPVMGNLAKGSGPEVMADFLPMICYEVIFSSRYVIGNPKYILNITNDVWFGTSSGPYQHLDMVRRQAIETGFGVIRANYGGISAIIDDNGRIVDSLPLGVRGTLDGYVPKSQAPTIYSRLGLNGVMLFIIIFSSISMLQFYYT
jgi:apolipoprotein N-acyltransferase